MAVKDHETHSCYAPFNQATILMVKPWWFPVPITEHAIAYDTQFAHTLIVSGIIFACAQCSLIAIAWRFRSGKATAGKSGAASSSRMELIWTAATAFVFLGLLALGSNLWVGLQFAAPPRNAEVIEVLAKQFAWSFRYPGPDGRFGRIGARLMNDAAGNPFGLDEGDVSGKDDIVSSTLRVPAGRDVKLMLTSPDVIHNFFVRELRIKQDIVPGMRIPLSFRANVIGTYEVPCAELCGLGHHQMRTVMIVMPPEDFDRWKREPGQ